MGVVTSHAAGMTVMMRGRVLSLCHNIVHHSKPRRYILTFVVCGVENILPSQDVLIPPDDNRQRETMLSVYLSLLLQVSSAAGKLIRKGEISI